MPEVDGCRARHLPQNADISLETGMPKIQIPPGHALTDRPADRCHPSLGACTGETADSVLDGLNTPKPIVIPAVDTLMTFTLAYVALTVVSKKRQMPANHDRHLAQWVSFGTRALDPCR